MKKIFHERSMFYCLLNNLFLNFHLNFRLVCFQHERFCTRAKDREPEVLFIGDSLIQSMQNYDVSTQCTLKKDRKVKINN